MLDLSVVIVNYNSSSFLQICLDALALALRDIKAETIVIDNQSMDDSCAIVKAHYPWVHLVENATNEGFGKANNRAIAVAKGKHVLLLNPDTIVQKETLLQSMSILNRDPKNGAVGVKMLDGSGVFLPESKRGLPTPEVAFYKAFGMAQLFPKSKRFARYYLGHLSSEEETEVEVLAGAYMMCDAPLLKACGGFDEDFFMYGEDIDLSYRMTQKGYKIFYSPEFPIIHFKGESAGRDAVWAKRFYEAMHLFSEKHFSDQGGLWSQVLNLGIRMRKMISTSAEAKPVSTDLSSLTLVVLSADTEIKKWDKVTCQFKSVFLQGPDNYNVGLYDAILFLPAVERKIQLEVIQQNAGEKQFFFGADHFVLTSPSSLSRGEVYSLL
ncbi:MAG: glycosyltransferase family 2 protein [Bacteroidales bacterium]|jgi:GT2 family glycosyltransferase|nr:glycosyltransferase family 2 protein [Bacteroidales bacterium]